MPVSDDVVIRVLTETKQSVNELAKFGATVGAIYVSVKKFFDVMNDLAETYYVQEKAQAKLGAVLQATGGRVGYTAGQLSDMASAMQQVTVFGDEAIMEAQALALTFGNIGKETFPRFMQAAADLSTILGTDLKGSVTQLGVAMEDPAEGMTRLRRAGVVFTEDQQKMVKALQDSGDTMGAQNLILEALEKRVGGAAVAMGKTAAGAAIQLKNAIGDLKETMGAFVADSMGPINREIASFVSGLASSLARARELKQLAGNENKSPEESLRQLELQLSKTTDRLKELKDAGSSTSRELLRVFETGAGVGASAAKKKLDEEEINKLQREQYSLALQILDAKKAIAAAVQQQKEAEAAPVEIGKKLLEGLQSAFDAAEGDTYQTGVAWGETFRAGAQSVFDASEGDTFGIARSFGEEFRESAQKAFDAVEGDTYAVLENVRNTELSLEQWAELWGDISQYQPIFRWNMEMASLAVADIVDDYGELVDHGAVIVTNTKAMASSMDGFSDAVNVASAMMDGRFMDSLKGVLNMLGPEGKIAAAFISMLEKAINFTKDSDIGDRLRDGLQSVFADAISTGDWSNVEQAIFDQIKAAVIEAIVRSAVLEPYIKEFEKWLKRWLRTGSDNAYQNMMDALADMVSAGANAGNIADQILDQIPVTVLTTPSGAPAGTTPGSLPSGNTVVNFYGPTFADETTMNRHVVNAVRQANSGY